MISKFCDSVSEVMMWVFLGLAVWFLFREGLSYRMSNCVLWSMVISNGLHISKLEKKLESQATDDNR